MALVSPGDIEGRNVYHDDLKAVIAAFTNFAPSAFAISIKSKNTRSLFLKTALPNICPIQPKKENLFSQLNRCILSIIKKRQILRLVKIRRFI